MNPAGTLAGKASEVITHYDKTGENLLTYENEMELRRLLTYVYHTKPPHIPSFLLKPVAESRGKKDKAFHQAIYMKIRSDEKHDLAQRLSSSDFNKKSKPIFLVWGEFDRILHVNGAQELKEVLHSNAQLNIMPNTGHCPHMEHPFATAKDYIQFLKNL